MSSNYNNFLYNDYEKEINKNRILSKENKILLLRAQVAESEQQRLENIVNENNKVLAEKNKEIEAYKQKKLLSYQSSSI